MADVTGIIKAVIGQAFAISPDGSRRLLTEGDRVFSEERIETSANGAVTVSLSNGETLDLGQDSLWDNAQISSTDTSDTTTSDVAEAQQAIAEGQDPTQTLEATAAGPQAGIVESSGEPGAGGAHTHVILDLTGEMIDPSAGYSTEGLDFPETEISEETTLLNPDTAAINPLSGPIDEEGGGSDEGGVDEPPHTQVIAKIGSETRHQPGTDPESDNRVIKYNGGSEDPSGLGFDVKDGNIVAIGKNVRVWITEDSSDFKPKCEDPNTQIKNYDSGNAVQKADGDNYSDIFVVNENSGSYDKSGNFISLNNIQGDNKGKYNDYIFVSGEGKNYSTTGNENSGHDENKYNGIEVKTASGVTIVHSTHLGGAIFADGPSQYFYGDVEFPPGKIITTLTIDIALNSTNAEEYLTKITLTGIPEDAHFNIDGVKCSYENGVYTLTFKEGMTSCKGEITITLPDNQQSLESINMQIDTSEHDYKTAFNGNEGCNFDSDAHPPGDVSPLMMAAMASNYIDIDATDDFQTENNALQTVNDTDYIGDDPFAEDTSSTESVDTPDSTPLETMEHELNSNDAGLDTFDGDNNNPLADHTTFESDPLNHRESATTDLPDTSENEYQEGSSDTPPDDADDNTLNGTETAQEDSSHHDGEYEIITTESNETISLNDIIHDDDNNINDLIQTPETVETTNSPQAIEPAPDVGSDVEGDDAWVNTDTNQVDHLIATNETES